VHELGIGRHWRRWHSANVPNRLSRVASAHPGFTPGYLPNTGPTGHALGRSPLLKLLIRVVMVKPGEGESVFNSCPNSAAALPPKWLIVPGMEFPPSCHVHVPSRIVLVKNG